MIHPCYVTMETYEFIYRYSKVLTQPISPIPFELKLAMPKPDRGGRGYSDELIEELQKQLA